MTTHLVNANIKCTEKDIQDVLDLLINCETANINKQLSFEITIWFPISRGSTSDIITPLFEGEPRIRTYRDGANELFIQISTMNVTTAIDYLRACKEMVERKILAK